MGNWRKLLGNELFSTINPRHTREPFHDIAQLHCSQRLFKKKLIVFDFEMTL